MPNNIANSFVDRRVTDAAILDFVQPLAIWDKVLPQLSVDKDTGLIPKMGLEHLRYTGTTLRNAYDESSHRVEFKYLTDSTYSINRHDKEVFLSQKLLENAGSPFNPRNDARMSLMQSVNIEIEKPLADNLTLNTNYDASNYSTPTNLWDTDLGTPLDDLTNASEEIEEDKGTPPNYVIISRNAFSKLKLNPQIRSAYNTSTYIRGANDVNQPMLNNSTVKNIIANHLDIPVQNVLIGGLKYTSSKEGQATETRADVWSKDVVLFYRPQNPTLWVPSFGYRVVRRDKGVDPIVNIRRHPSDPDLGEMVKISWHYQDLILDWDSAYLLEAVIS